MNKTKERKELWDKFCKAESLFKTLKSSIQNNIEYEDEMTNEFYYMEQEFNAYTEELFRDTKQFMARHRKKENN